MARPAYSARESFEHAHDAAGNRTAMTATLRVAGTTPLSGTVVTTSTYDIASRLTNRAVSDGRVYTYTWSARGQMLAEWTQGYPVRTFTYDGAGRMVEATVFTQTTRFTYTSAGLSAGNSMGARVTVEVVGQGTTTVTLDYAAGNRILAEETDAGATLYLYGHDCLGKLRDDEPGLSGVEGWLYYLSDAEGLVRQGTDEQGQVVSAWLFDPDGTVLEGPEGPVSHLVCGGVYDWSTGLIYKDGLYFDPLLGIWLALIPLIVIQSWRGRKKKRCGFPWVVMVTLCLAGTSAALTACGRECPPPEPIPDLCTYLTGTPQIKSFTSSLGEVHASDAWNNKWQLHFGHPADDDQGRPPGISFNATVRIPESTSGYLEFLQIGYVHEMVWTVPEGRWQVNSNWLLDYSDPYPLLGVPEGQPQSLYVNAGPEREVQIATSDSPAMTPDYFPIRGSRVTQMRADQRFRMYLLWRPEGGIEEDRMALGVIAWQWAGQAKKTSRDPEKWQLVGTPFTCSEYWRCVSGGRLPEEGYRYNTSIPSFRILTR